MDAVRQVSCSDRAALARETARFVADALASHPGRFVALAVGDSTLPLYAGLDAIGPAWAGRSIMPVDELVPTPADPDRRFSARLAAALPGELRRRLIPIEVEGDPQLRAIALDAPARVVDLAPGNLARLGPVEPARSALTLGVTTILAAGAVLVVASGPGKAEALDRLVHGPGDPAWPVTWLRRHPRLTVAIGPGVVSP